jgi:hypothetical protein
MLRYLLVIGVLAIAPLTSFAQSQQQADKEKAAQASDAQTRKEGPVWVVENKNPAPSGPVWVVLQAKPKKSLG